MSRTFIYEVRVHKKNKLYFLGVEILIGLRYESVGILSYFELSQRNPIRYISI